MAAVRSSSTARSSKSTRWLLSPDGALLVGTSPGGRIYRVDARGQPTTFFDPEDTYIWALAADPKGVVYAATGDKGTVYRITPDGKGEPFFNSRATHATTLRVESSGALVVGTANPARVFRVDGPNKGFLLLDTSFQEVRALRHDAKGVLYVAALNGKTGSTSSADTDEPPPTPTPPPTPSVSSDIVSFAVIDVPVSGQAAPSQGSRDSGTASGAIYRIQPDGLYDLLWESKNDSPYDVSVEPDGSLLVATGDKGKIFRLSGDPVIPVLVTQRTGQARDDHRATEGPHAAGDGQSGAAGVDVEHPREPGHLRLGGQGCQGRRLVGSALVARDLAGWHEGGALHASRQHEDA